MPNFDSLNVMLRIALVSFEYPLYTGYGGIATWIHDVAQMFTSRGHHVTVFCAGHADEVVDSSEHLRVCVVGTLDKDDFANCIMPLFRREHETNPFDVVESAEIYGDTSRVKQEFPNLPLVVKLQTPSFLLHRMHYRPVNLWSKLRFCLGGLRRGRLSWLREDLSVLRAREERERLLYYHADGVTSPSKSMALIAEKHWGMRSDPIVEIPNQMAVPPVLAAASTAHKPIQGVFVGQLEVRKGLVPLVQALRILEKTNRAIPFVFVGHDYPLPGSKMSMKEWALRHLRQHHLYSFTGRVSKEEALSVVSSSDIVVLPSLWECFGYTCIEAMSQEKVVLASANGGMADIIRDGQDGFLLREPGDPRYLASKIEWAVSNYESLDRVRQSARQRVLDEYSLDAVYGRHLAIYEKAISCKH
jgi:glycogen synthase